MFHTSCNSLETFKSKSAFYAQTWSDKMFFYVYDNKGGSCRSITQGDLPGLVNETVGTVDLSPSVRCAVIWSHLSAAWEAGRRQTPPSGLFLALKPTHPLSCQWEGGTTGRRPLTVSLRSVGALFGGNEWTDQTTSPLGNLT